MRSPRLPEAVRRITGASPRRGQRGRSASRLHDPLGLANATPLGAGGPGRHLQMHR
jgi:hypothetical protein